MESICWRTAGTRPVGRSSTLPVILLRSPYGRRPLGMLGRLFAERGYQVVIQSCRGTFGSGGQLVPFRNEEADGRATLEWIARPTLVRWEPGDVRSELSGTHAVGGRS